MHEQSRITGVRTRHPTIKYKPPAIRIVKIECTIHLYRSRAKALLYIPLKYEKRIQRYLHAHVIVKCTDCKLQMSFAARIRIVRSAKYTTYSIFVPKRFVTGIAAEGGRCTVEITRL